MRSVDTALQPSPVGFERVGMDRTAHVLFAVVIHRAVGVADLRQVAVLERFVGRDPQPCSPPLTQRRKESDN